MFAPSPRLLLLLLLAAASGCAPPPHDSGPPLTLADPFETALERAEQDLRRGRPEVASKGFAAALKERPADLRSRAGLAESYLAMGRGDAATAVYAGWPSGEAEAPQVTQGRGLAALLAGDTAAAEALLSRAVNADPSLWRAWNALGLLHDRSRDWDQADHCWRQALAVRPDAATVHNNRGYSLLRRGRHADAAEALRKARELDPTLGEAQGNLVLAHALDGGYDRALATVPSEALPEALNNVGVAALLRGDYASAEAYFLRAIQDSPRHFERAHENLRWLRHLKGEVRQ